jgi:hypothetical protein
MIEIKDLLARFNHILSSNRSKIELIKKALHSVLGVELENNDIKMENNTIFITTKPIYKNEILLKKDKILSKLKELLGEGAPTDIR